MIMKNKYRNYHKNLIVKYNLYNSYPVIKKNNKN